MSGNSFGKFFKITTCGESHGEAIAVIVDGCPAGFEISEKDIQHELDRRKPGQNYLTTPRKEADTIHILSGIFEGKTTGTPILLIAYNEDAIPADYEKLKNIIRPSHADFTYLKKYNIRDFRGSGRASARETLARVAAGAIAKKYLHEKLGIEILSFVDQIGDIKADFSNKNLSRDDINSSLVRCPDKATSDKMIQLIEKVKSENDSIGGAIQCVITHVPPGLGEPVFDKLPADLAKAMLSINAAKGFEIGEGFNAATMRGSEHNDAMQIKNDRVTFLSNHAGGVLGGISTGENIYFRVAFKPVATIGKMQQSINLNHQNIEFAAEGRHDPCVVPRAVPIVDAMAALVLMDHYVTSKH